MIFSQNELHAQMASLPGEYKELFLERSHDLGVRMVNGRMEPVSSHETVWVSLLLSEGKYRFFDARESLTELENIFRAGHSFSASVWAMAWEPKGLSWSLQSRDTLGDMQALSERVFPRTKVFWDYEWITSHMVSIGLWDRSYIALSNRNSGGQDSQYHIRVVVMITGKRGEVNQENFKVSYCMGNINDLTEERILALFNDAISELDALLDAPISPSGEMDIVIAAEAGGVIIHEAVGHGLEGDLQASSAYANRIGKKVASDAVTIVDDPTLLGLRGSYSIDHEGHPAARAELIKNGILQNYLHQQGTADFLKLPHNGHARRESYSAEAIVRMGNTYMDNGPDSPADIIASVSDGLYVTSLWGGQVNTTSGDFVFKVNFARRIRNGKIEEVVRWANLAGNGPKMLQEIEMVGNDLPVGHLTYFCGGTCGKDGQGMPVTDANPTIKVRLKVTG